CPPLPGACIGTSFWRADRPKPADGQLSSGQIRPVTPAFFRTLGIPQVAGRDFSESATAEATPVAIVSDALVPEHFGGDNPLRGRLRVNIEHANGRSDVEWTIVGVVGSIKSSLDGPYRQTMYLPAAQRGIRGLGFFVRTARDPMLLAATVEAVIHARE